MPRRPRPAADPALACAYLRTSTDDQANGLAAQRDAIEAFAKAKGLRIVAVHEDAGVSGAKAAADRPGFAAAVVAMKETNAGVLLIAKRDRLARDVIEAAVATRLIERQGAHIRSADGVSHGDTADAKLLRTLLDAFSEYERALIRSRTKAALQARRVRGQRFSMHPPFGFSHKDGQVVPDPAQQKTHARMKLLRAKGLTFREIGERLTREGCRPARAKSWSTMVLRKLIARA